MGTAFYLATQLKTIFRAATHANNALVLRTTVLVAISVLAAQEIALPAHIVAPPLPLLVAQHAVQL